mgnify:CR=1 FL=1
MLQSIKPVSQDNFSFLVKAKKSGDRFNADYCRLLASLSPAPHEERIASLYLSDDERLLNRHAHTRNVCIYALGGGAAHTHTRPNEHTGTHMRAGRMYMFGMCTQTTHTHVANGEKINPHSPRRNQVWRCTFNPPTDQSSGNPTQPNRLDMASGKNNQKTHLFTRPLVWVHAMAGTQ